MTKHLVMQALFRAVATRRPPAGLIQHTDRGSQYCALAYQSLLSQFDMRASMSRRANCSDNAPIESFWGTLKNELVYPSTLRHARAGSELDQRIHRDLL